QRREQHFLAVACVPRDVHQAAAQDEESCARLSFLRDVFSIGVRALVNNPRQVRELSMREVLEEIGLFEEANQVGGWPVGRLGYWLEQRARWNSRRVRLIHTILTGAEKLLDTR